MFRARKRRSLGCANCLRPSATSCVLIEIADFDLVGVWRNSRRIERADRVDPASEKREGTAGNARGICVRRRAVSMARRDYTALSEAAALFSAQLWDVPEQIRKSVEESKLLRKQKDDALDELAEADGFGRSRFAAGDERAEDGGADVFRPRHQFRQIVCAESDANGNAGDCAGGEHGRSSGAGFCADRLRRGAQRADMGALLKQVLSSVGGRGGGSRDFAQGGVPAGSNINVEQLLREAAATIGS
jgi:alanyl-tRNA synthetase